MKKISLFLTLLLSLLPGLRAELTLPGVISDHMLLQQGQADPVWGWDAPGTKITVTFAGQSYETTAGADGSWQVKLAAPTASSTPQTLTIAGTTTVIISDVLVGEVWLCSGQSNMEMGVGMVQNGSNEIAAADYPDIRLLKVPKLWLPLPATNQAAD